MSASPASAIITKLVSFVEDAAKSSLSTATTAKLTAVATLLGEGGDMLAGYLESKYPNIDNVLTAFEAVEDDAIKMEADAIKMEADVLTLIAAIKSTGNTTGTVAAAA